jgi:hypothetical protein
MPNREFIHASEDVAKILKFVIELGLIIRVDQPTIDREPKVLSVDEIEEINRGVFFIFHPNWFFGEDQYIQISDGINRGKYSISPRVNGSPITLYFGGERIDGDILRLGSGFLSWDKKWLYQPEGTIHNAPREVGIVYEKIIKFMDMRKSLKGGIHTYMVLEAAWCKLNAKEVFPPFDYILWPPVSK